MVGEVLFDLSQYGPATLIIEDFLLDEKGDIRYEQLRMNTTLDVPYYKTSNVSACGAFGVGDQFCL